jgi:AcrR family transcriptional regulator
MKTGAIRAVRGVGPEVEALTEGASRRRPAGGEVAADDAAGTRERILAVAERLFAERGYNGVSLRALTAAAGANLASVGYHFGSKEGLLAAIFDRHCQPMMDERRRRLAACTDAPNQTLLLERIIEAFVAPAIIVTADAKGGGTTFSRLRAVLANENHELAKQLIARHFDDTSRMFIAALQRCLPHLDRDAVYWRFHFLLAALYYTTVDPERIRVLSNGRCDPTAAPAAVRELVKFVSAGFRAP